MERPDTPIAILASGVTLGVYLPALLVRNQLRARGFDARLEILETLYPPALKERLHRNKRAFHDRFEVALMGQKLAQNVSAGLDPTLTRDILREWSEQGRRRFIVFSGFWMPVVRQFAAALPAATVLVDRCHMDASVSVSWATGDNLRATESLRERDIWFFSANGAAMHEIPITDAAPTPYVCRDHRVVMHGGGWGIGTYQRRAQQLSRADFDVDLVVHDLAEAVDLERRRCIMLRPGWDPWVRNQDGEYDFPPMGQVRHAKYEEVEAAGPYHRLFDYIRGAKAIISKPGGMTLVDSLASATPLIHLEPFGEYEARNAELWERLGFGVSFADWLANGARLEPLERLHLNLVEARGSFSNYGERYPA